MSEPKRWLEESIPRDVERLVRAAQAEQPGEASLERTLAALGIGLGATGVATAAGAAAASVNATAKVTAPITVGLLAKWAAYGATLGTLSVGAATIARNPPWLAPAPSVEPPAQLRPDSIRVAPPVPDPAVVAPGSAGSVTEPVTAPPAGAAAAPASGMPLGAAPAAVAASDASLGAETLAAEVKTVDRARAALASGRAAQTLTVLDEYERNFSEGRFAPETLYLRMEAFVSLGRMAQARAAAGRLLTSYPNGPHSARARVVFTKNP